MSTKYNKEKMFWDTKYIERKLDDGCGCKRGQKMNEDQRDETLGLSATRKTFKVNQDLELSPGSQIDAKKYDIASKNETFAAELPKDRDQSISEQQDGTESFRPKTKVLYSNRASQQLMANGPNPTFTAFEEVKDQDSQTDIFQNHQIMTN